MKKIITTLVVVLCVSTLLLMMTNNTGNEITATESVSKNTLVITMFTKNGKRTNALSFEAPFLKGLESSSIISIAVDINGDGLFSLSETFIENTPVFSDTSETFTYVTTSNTVFTDDLLAKVLIDKTEFIANTKVITQEVTATDT